MKMVTEKMISSAFE